MSDPVSKTTVIASAYEYAGFRYVIIQNDDGSLQAKPVPGQHSAANKDKHRQAAVETFKSIRT